MEKANYAKTVESKFPSLRGSDKYFKSHTLKDIEGIVTSCRLVGPENIQYACGDNFNMFLELDKPFKTIQIDGAFRIDIGEKVRVFYEAYGDSPIIHGKAIEVFNKEGKVKFKYHTNDCVFVYKEPIN